MHAYTHAYMCVNNDSQKGVLTWEWEYIGGIGGSVAGRAGGRQGRESDVNLFQLKTYLKKKLTKQSKSSGYWRHLHTYNKVCNAGNIEEHLQFKVLFSIMKM